MRKWFGVFAAFAGVCLFAQAKEIVWTGSVDTDFATAGNWSGGAPAAGDTAKFNDEVTITGSFDFGAGGLTVEVASGKTLTCQTAFAGAGRLTKTGAGTLAFVNKNTGTFTGGLRVEAGKLAAKYSGAWNLTIGDSSNVVTLVMTGSADDPKVAFPDWGSCFNNPVHVTGTCLPGASVFQVSNTSVSYRGTYSTDCDSQIACGQSGTTTISGSGAIDVSGHTLTLNASGASTVLAVGAKGKSILGNLATMGVGRIAINGEGTDSAATLSVSNRVTLCNSWAGSAVVSGESAVLTLDRNTDNNTIGSISGASSVSLVDGGKIVLGTGVSLAVKSLSVDGTPVAAGIHPVSEFDGRIEGDGDVMVGCKTWSGGSTGLLSDGANWADNTPPVCGDALVFGQTVTLEAEDFTLASGSGLTFLIPGNDTVVTCKTDFNGTGGLTLEGKGYLRFRRKVNGSFTGGVRVAGGKLSVVNGSGSDWSCTIGDASNVVTLVMAGDAANDPMVVFSNYSCGLNNKVVVTGTSVAGRDTFCLGDSGSMNGDVESTTDIQFGTHCGSRALRVEGNVDVGSRVIVADTNNNKGDVVMFGECNTNSGNILFTKTIAGNLTTRGQGHTEIFSSGVSADALLRVESETYLYNAWAGNIVVTGATLHVTKTNAWGKSTTCTLSPTATVRIENGGRILLENGKPQSVAELIINGEPVSKGIHMVEEFGEAVVGSGMILVGAQEKKWVGGSSGLLTDGANWSDGQPAQAGDVLIFEKNVTLNALDDDALFDLGTGDLAFVVDSDCTLTSETKYSGTGRLVKYGAGTLKIVIANSGTFSGGVRVEDGTFSAAQNSAWGTNIGDGKGIVEVVVGPGRTSKVENSSYGARVNNPIRVTGSNAPSGVYSLVSNDRGGFRGLISADVDFAIVGGYYSSHFLGGISAPTNTVTVNAGTSQFDGATPRTCYLEHEIDASIVKIGPARLRISNGTTNEVNSLTVTEGQLFLEPAAVWSGTNVVVSGETSELWISARQNFATNVVVTISDGGRLYVTNGVGVKVASLVVNDTPVETGVYTAGNLPAVISGEGRVLVGPQGMTIILR